MLFLTHLRNCLAGLVAIAATLALMPTATLAQTKIATSGDQLKTAGSGKQILFRDNTSVKAGTDTALTVRRADYDAATGKPNVVINVAKGAFRYVTGDTTGSHTVKTPQATVGVRGTVIEGFVDSRGFEVFALMEGAFDVCTPLGCKTLTTPGTFVVVSPGGVIGEPMAIPPQIMDSLLLPTPSLNLVLEYFFNIVASAHDPLPRFRDLNATRNSKLSNPEPCSAPEWGEGEGEGYGFKGAGFASAGFKSNYGCGHNHHHHHHGGGHHGGHHGGGHHGGGGESE